MWRRNKETDAKSKLIGRKKIKDDVEIEVDAERKEPM